MAPNTEFGTDNKSKGFTRSHCGYLQQREDSDDEWGKAPFFRCLWSRRADFVILVHAVRHSEIRHEMIEYAARQGSYRKSHLDFSSSERH